MNNPRVMWRSVILVAVVALGNSCLQDAGPSASPSPSVTAGDQLTQLVPATEHRPYSLMLPDGWAVEETVHSDGGSFVIPSGPDESVGGKVYGVVEPSGKIVRFNAPPSKKEIQAIEADGSHASDPVSVSVSGRPGWEMVITNDDPMSTTVLMVQVDVGEGASFSLNFSWATDDYPESLFRAIVDSVKIDDTMLEATLAASEG